jgi:hypothetical protein
MDRKRIRERGGIEMEVPKGQRKEKGMMEKVRTSGDLNWQDRVQ